MRAHWVCAEHKPADVLEYHIVINPNVCGMCEIEGCEKAATDVWYTIVLDKQPVSSAESAEIRG